MTTKERARFRATKAWKDWRKRIKELWNGKDALTGKPLRRGWNLHHLDMNHDEECYTDLSNESRFLPLNRESHDTVHFLYTYYRKDPDILDRLEDILQMMKNINEDD